ncbi:MAG TPA: HEAT repeat domain-containing protein [Lacipirellulaceae bacterium]|jgi:HEAT repeat protein|nr:HEAT repeat domain-containing protein [Lacipirellulaceae bacterium]
MAKSFRFLFVVSITIFISLPGQAPLTARAADWTADQLSRPFPAVASEEQLIEILRTAEPAEKAFACKQLAIQGSKAAVPELAKLLADEQLASWARVALEAIPDPSAEKALIEAAEKLDGKLLIGVINSIGVRRPVAAVEQLSTCLKDKDTDVACAAAVALGKIGDDHALHALHEQFADAPPVVRAAIAEGGVLCAERMLSEGKSDTAVAIYDVIRSSTDLPKQRILEATRGAIIARGPDGIELLVEQLKSSDNAMFQIALMTARELAGPDVAKALAGELAGAPPERAALIVLAIGDRNDKVLPPAVLQAARGGDARVRRAAIEVVGKLGSASSVATLLEIASGSDRDLSPVAKAALTRLSGDEVNAELIRRVSDAKGNSIAILFETIGQRRINATPQLVKAINHSDETVRRAALKALGATAARKDLAVLVSAATEPKNSGDAKIAWQALEAASIRMPDREATAADLTRAMDGASVATKGRLLRILGAMGGPKALATIAAAAQSDDAQLQDSGTRVLGEWMTADAAEPLYRIASSDHRYKTRALRGYLRIARQLDLPDNERLAMCRKALKIAERPDERKLALDALKRCASTEAIELASALIDDRELRQPAVETAIFIGEKIKSTDPAAAKSAGEKALEAKPPRELAERARALANGQ